MIGYRSFFLYVNFYVSVWSIWKLLLLDMVIYFFKIEFRVERRLSEKEYNSVRFVVFFLCINIDRYLA